MYCISVKKYSESFTINFNPINIQYVPCFITTESKEETSNTNCTH